MSSDFPREGLLAFCALPAELLVPEELLDALKALEDIARSMTAWIQSVVPLSSDTLTSRELGVTLAESSSRVLCFPGRSMSKKAPKGDVKAVHSQGLWPKEPENRFILAKIKKLLKNALYAADILEAMEYLMAARGLLRGMEKE